MIPSAAFGLFILTWCILLDESWKSFRPIIFSVCLHYGLKLWLIVMLLHYIQNEIFLRNNFSFLVSNAAKEIGLIIQAMDCCIWHLIILRYFPC